MKLEQVTGRPFIVFCLKCSKKQYAGDVDGQKPVYADLDGVAFKAYYCSDCVESLDQWIPANAGTETPFVARTGKRLLYCFQPSTGRHAYLDLGTDIILTDEEASAALAL